MKKQIILATLTLFLALTVCSVATAAESIDNSTNSTTLGQATDQNSFVAYSNSSEMNTKTENLTNDDTASIASTFALDPGVSNISQGTLPDPQIWRNGVYVDTYTTIQAAIDAAQNGDTIMLEDGATFYEYGFLIDKDLTFNVLNGGHATIDAQFHEIFYIISGVTVNLYNLTLQNGLNFAAVDGGAITNEGTLNIAECTFTNNCADWGGAISNWNYLTVIGSIFTGNVAINGGGAINNYYGTLTVIGCTFTNNVADWGDGGAIYNHGTLNITDSNFTTNNAYNHGGAICNDSGTILNITNTTFTGNYVYNDGGAISNDSGTILNITNTTFTGNDASSFGGAIYNYYGNYYDTLNITNSNFTCNTASNGGAIYNDSGIFNITQTTFTYNTASIANRGSVISTYTGLVVLNFNRIIGNTNPAVTSWGRLIDATLNWWGSNESPIGEVSGNVNYDPWIFLTVTADPSSINIGETSTITADLLHDSTYAPANPDASYHDPADGHVPEVPLTLELNPDWGTLTYNPGSGWSIKGNYTADGLVPIPPSVRVYANADDEQNTVYTDITISLNEPPVLDLIGNKSTDENQKLEFTINATDPDGDALTYSANNLPQGATFNTNSGAFSWTPDYTQSGVYIVTFTVSDGNLTDSEEVPITVNNMNRPPVLDEIGPKTVNENETLQFTVTGNDPDGDSLTYTASNLLSGATFENGVFSWTPDYTQSGLYTVTFTVSDGNLTDIKEVPITVNNMNRPPVLDEIGPKTVNENETLQFTVTGNDPDGDSLTYTASNLPSGATFENGVFSWTPDYTQSGLYTVTFTVSDGNLTDNEDVSIIVNNVNRAPSASINDSYFVNLPITMRVAGIPGNKITLEIVQEGLVITSASLIKETGLFKDQEINLSTKIDLSKPFSGRLLFEAGPSGWGANPVWLIIDGKKTLITTFIALPYLSFTKKQTRNLQLKELFTLVGKEITFNAIANDPDINNITFTWTFGDNPTPKIQTHTSDGVNTITDTTTHTYTTKGTYTINLKVRDDEGAEVTKTKTIKIW